MTTNKFSFGSVRDKGGADKTEHYKMRDGDNSVRIFGDILPRYVYWVKLNGKTIPFECLGFNRDTQRFENIEKDWVKEYFPDLKCQWSYSIMCLDNLTPKVFDFKSKLFQQIKSNLEDLGDPTDPENGWMLKFNKAKTGPLPINVEYTLQTVKCLNSKGPFSEEELAAIKGSKSIHELIPRPTPEEQKAGLERLINSNSEDETIDEEISDELNISN